MIDALLLAAQSGADTASERVVEIARTNLAAFVESLGQAAGANELLYDAHGKRTAGQYPWQPEAGESEPTPEDGARCRKHFIPAKKQIAAERILTRHKDGKMVYKMRTKNVDADMAWETYRPQENTQWEAELSWTELWELRNVSTALSDKEFRQAVPECNAPPTFPATYSYGMFSTQPEQRLKDLNERFFVAWAKWDTKMRTEYGFAITGVCGIRQLLDSQSNEEATPK